MRNRVLILVAALAGAAVLSAAAQQPRRANTMTIDEVLAEYRNDLQANRVAIITKNVPLTPEQAARFWPVFERYQKEQNAIMDAQLRSIQSYILNFETMNDSAALALIEAHLDRDTNMATLRKQWLAEFMTVLPTKQAIRVMQIDRRISLAQQTEFTAQIPLVQ